MQLAYPTNEMASGMRYCNFEYFFSYFSWVLRSYYPTNIVWEHCTLYTLMEMHIQNETFASFALYSLLDDLETARKITWQMLLQIIKKNPLVSAESLEKFCLYISSMFSLRSCTYWMVSVNNSRFFRSFHPSEMCECPPSLKDYYSSLTQHEDCYSSSMSHDASRFFAL